MKKSFKFFIIAFLLIIYVYLIIIDNIPNNIILYNGEELNFNSLFGITLDIQNKDVFASSNISENVNISQKAYVKLFNIIKIKDVTVDIIKDIKVIPVGQISGLKLYSNNILVVGLSQIKGEDNLKHKPYLDSGIREGDRIIRVNQKEVTNIDELINITNNSNGNLLKIEYVRDGKILTGEITPIKIANGEYKLGLWVRDSAAGIGTLTFFVPKTRKFCSFRTWYN